MSWLRITFYNSIHPVWPHESLSQPKLHLAWNIYSTIGILIPFCHNLKKFELNSAIALPLPS